MPIRVAGVVIAKDGSRRQTKWCTGAIAAVRAAQALAQKENIDVARIDGLVESDAPADCGDGTAVAPGKDS
jgi:hypothetical protein